MQDINNRETRGSLVVVLGNTLYFLLYFLLHFSVKLKLLKKLSLFFLNVMVFQCRAPLCSLSALTAYNKKNLKE